MAAAGDAASSVAPPLAPRTAMPMLPPELEASVRGLLRQDPRARWLVHFRFHPTLNDFCLAEIDSLLTGLGIAPRSAYDPGEAMFHSRVPFLRLRLPDEASAVAICARAVLVKAVYDLWGLGMDVPSLLVSARECPLERRAAFYDGPWCALVEGPGTTVSMSEKATLRNAVCLPLLGDVLAFRGPVRLSGQRTVLSILKVHAMHSVSAAADAAAATGGEVPLSIKNRRFLAKAEYREQLKAQGLRYKPMSSCKERKARRRAVAAAAAAAVSQATDGAPPPALADAAAAAVASAANPFSRPPLRAGADAGAHNAAPEGGPHRKRGRSNLVASATPENGSALEREQAQEQEQEHEQEEGRTRSSSRSTCSGGADGRALFYFLGREVARAPSRDKFSLKRRAFLGPTSMESDMAFLMANQGLARPGALIMDPFVGTGSVLVPCAQLGAVCFGGDIDYLTLRGKNGATAFDSFDQLGLPRPDLLRLDFSPKGRCMREPAGGLLDAIVCDPPYGIRAGARKVGSSKQVVTPIPEEHRAGHVAQTQVYETSELMVDLVDAAARLLKLGGRLVYLLPVERNSYTPDCVPAHACLELIANCEQRLSGPVSRRLITMHKVRPYDYTQGAAYVATGRAQLAVPALDELDAHEGPDRPKP